MKNGQMILTLTLALCASGVAFAQDDQAPSPPPPAAAFGLENPAAPVTENPPLSGIDQPGLNSHAAPESFLMYGLHFSESVDSNVGNQLGGSSISSVTRGLGSVTLQRLWHTYDVAMDYIGGVAYYDQTGIGVEQLQQFDIDNRINWKRGQLAIRDSFSYLPEGIFGFGAYGGGGAYSAGVGSGGMLGGSGFGAGVNSFFSGNGLSVGQVPRLTNQGLVDVVEALTPKSSVTVAAGYGVVHFYGDLFSIGGTNENVSFVGSSDLTGQVAYNRVLNPKDQVAISYGYQGFTFSTVDSKFHTNVVQLMYGHRISGRLDALVSAGPQFTHLTSNPLVCSLDPFIPVKLCPPVFIAPFPQTANHTTVAGRILFHYRFPKTTVFVSLQRYNTSGDGLYAGSLSETAHLGIQRPLSRVWDLFSDIGYAKNHRLQLAGSAVNAGSFQFGYAGIGLHRQFGRSLRGFVSYQFNGDGFDTSCPVPGTGGIGQPGCSSFAQRHVGTVGLDWTPRPRRLD